MVHPWHAINNWVADAVVGDGVVTEFMSQSSVNQLDTENLCLVTARMAHARLLVSIGCLHICAQSRWNEVRVALWTCKQNIHTSFNHHPCIFNVMDVRWVTWTRLFVLEIIDWMLSFLSRKDNILFNATLSTQFPQWTASCQGSVGRPCATSAASNVLFIVPDIYANL